jgi:hypothetical protein
LTKRTFNIILLSIILVTVISCKRDTITPDYSFYKYFPSNKGHWATYHVDSTRWDGFYAIGDSLHERSYKFEIKEVIESTFLDNENRPTQRIERYKKASDTTDWFLKDIWFSNLTSSTAEKVEENIRFIKLVFPMSNGQTWNGNALNIFGEQDYEYDNINEPFTIDSLTYDSTVTVIQKIEPLLISDVYMIEVYAKNIGLIYKRYRQVELVYPTNDIKEGRDYTYKLINYGN